MITTVRSHSSTTPFVTRPFALTRADQITRYCTTIAHILNRAPLFDGTGNCMPRSKVIGFADWDDARICHIFNSNSQKIVGEHRAWHIHNFGCGNHQLYDRKGQRIRQGVELDLFDDLVRCSLEELEQSYTTVFSQLISGWVKADIKDHSNILFKRNPEEFDLYIKNRSLVEESTLFNAIASKLSIYNDVRCYDHWLQVSGPVTHERPYLWIRKSALPTVVEKIGLRFKSRM